MPSPCIPGSMPTQPKLLEARLSAMVMDSPDSFLLGLNISNLSIKALAGQSSSFNPKHTSKKSSEWFQYKDINVMKCHEWSPDLALLNICGNSSNGSSMQMRSLLLVTMSFGSKCIWNEENTLGGLWKLG
jgi:hypothetical protein